MNLAGILEQAARYFPDRIVVVEDSREYTYSDLNSESDRVASALAATNIEPGQFAAICLPNGRRWLSVYFGIMKAGCTAVTLAFTLTGQELSATLMDCKPAVFFTTESKLTELGDNPDLPHMEDVVVSENGREWESFLSKGDTPRPIVNRDRNDVASILYTGGTTGIPKGVMLSHRNLLASAHNVARQERSTENDRALCFLPLNHVFGQIHVMLSTILTAGSLVMMPGFDMDAVLKSITEGGVTKFYSVPTVYVRMLGMEDIGSKLGTVRYSFSAAASMARELVREWKQATGLDIHEAYGMTESASMVTYNHYHRHKVGSVGTPVGTIEVKIMDAEGREVPPGTEGEICIQGPNIMQGYLNRPEETQKSFFGPWFRSGDIGYLDEEGYLFIVDRLKDMIITGGENVYPREVEEILYTLPGVEECSVVGLPDREYGERVTAAIKLKPGAALSEEEVKVFLRERLTRFKIPKSILIVDDLPKSAAGKILKRELRQNLME